MVALVTLASGSALNGFMTQNRNVLVAFFHRGCEQCKASKPHFEALADKYALSDRDVEIGIMYESNLCQYWLEKYKIRTFPAYVLFHSSRETRRVFRVTDVEGMLEIVAPWGLNPVKIEGNASYRSLVMEEARKKAIREARKTIANLFSTVKCFRFPVYDEQHNRVHRYDSGDLMEAVNGAFQVVRLLEEFPVLASERFACCGGEGGGEFFALAFFVWNNFDEPILAKVHALNPRATELPYSQEDPTPLLNYVCKNYNKGSINRGTLLFLAKSVAKTFDTGTPLLDYLSDEGSKEGDGRWRLEGPAKASEIAEVLLSKNPQFPTGQAGTRELLNRLLAMDCKHNLFKKALHRLPVECRILSLYRDLLEDIFLDYEHWNPPAILQEDLPELTELTFELFCVDDHKELLEFLEVIGTCSKLRKLCLHVATELVCTNIATLDRVLTLIQQMSLATNRPQISIRLHEGYYGEIFWWHDWNYEENPDIDEEDDSFDNMTMPQIDNECLQYLLRGLRSRLGQPQVPPILEEIELYGIKGPYYELVAQLSPFASKLSLECIELGSSSSFARHLCELWKQNSRQPCCGPHTKAMRLLASFCSKLNLKIRNTAFQQRFPTIPLQQLGSLKQLQFSTDRNSKLDLFQFCEVVKNNNQLEALELDGLDFCRSDGRSVHGYSVNECFWGMLEVNTSKKLCFLMVGSKYVHHFVNCSDSFGLWPGLGTSGTEKNYASFGCPHVDKIQRLLLMNKYGLADFRDDSISIKTLAKHLQDVDSAPFEKVLPELNPYFLLGNEECHLLSTSITYSLLREAPHLWCCPRAMLRLERKRRFSNLSLERPASRQRCVPDSE